MSRAGDVYPMWKFYPSAIEPPEWVAPVVAAFGAVRPQIDSRLNVGVSSDAALAALRPELVRQGFEVEGGKTRAGRIRRPVLFGEVGAATVGPLSLPVPELASFDWRAAAIALAAAVALIRFRLNLLAVLAAAMAAGAVFTLL